MSETAHSVPTTEEWTYHQDNLGVVYCLGRQVTDTAFEAVAAYERTDDGHGKKYSLETNTFYNRVMYHGLPEERLNLLTLSPKTRESVIQHQDPKDSRLLVTEQSISGGAAPPMYRSIESWLDRTDRATAQYRQALTIACSAMEGAGVSLEGAHIYGGAAFGLISPDDQPVDDIDLLLQVDGRELYEGLKSLQTSYTWTEVDPLSSLSERRRVMKAKRWATSQVRMHVPHFMSIDLKTARRDEASNRWQSLPDGELPRRPFQGSLRVVDDSEAFCISPTLYCEDSKGEERLLLLQGYPYIGAAVKDDVITVRGAAYEGSSVIYVSQAEDDLLVPDFRNVPVE